MLLVLVWSVVLVVTAIFWWIRDRRKFSSLRGVPGPKPLPIVGNFLDLLSSDNVVFFNKMRMWAKTYKDIYILWALNKPIINIYSPEDVETILSSSTLTKKSFIYEFIEPWLMDGLLLSYGSKWQTRRKMLTPAFHFNILKEFCHNFEANSQRLVCQLQQEIEKDRTDIRPFVGKYSLDTICDTAMGTKLDEKSEIGTQYTEGIKKLGEMVLRRVSRIWLHNDTVFKLSSMGREFYKTVQEVHSFPLKVIKERRENMPEVNAAFEEESRGGRKVAMMDLLLSAEKQGKIDERGIHEEVETFMFEGHDTTTAGITFLLLLLANNPEKQAKASEELLEVFGASDRPAGIEDLHKLGYLGACVKEAQRIYPSVAFVSRAITHDVQLKSCVVPAGTVCHIQIMDMHHRADLWKEPEVFSPERFLAGSAAPGERVHPYAYVPFSAGPRNCIGQKFAILEMKSAVAAILRNFRLLAVTRPEEVVFRADAVLRPDKPIYINFKLRN